MYKKNSQSWLKHSDFMLIDLLCLQISFMAAYFIRNGMQSPYANSLYRNMALVLTLISIAVSVFFETFNDVLKRGMFVEFSITVKHAIMVELLAAFYLFSTQAAGSYSRMVLYLTGMIYVVFTYVMRLGWKSRLKRKMSDRGSRSLLIVTLDGIADECVKSVIENNYEMFYIAGIAVLDKNRKGGCINSVPVVANKDDLLEYVCREWVDEVFINVPDNMARPDGLLESLSKMGVVAHVKLAKDNDFTGKRQFVEKMGTYTVLTTSINYATPRQLFMKRMLDICGGLAGTFITGILCLIVAPVIKIQSPGPVFFGQERVGKNGKKFKMYKFRTMYLDAEERKKDLMAQNRVKDGMMFKLDFDPRIIGNKLLPDGTQKRGFMDLCRKLSIDEWPQFYNILIGDMSLVGTRPPTVDEWEKYELHHRARLAAKPGLTGMWQVSGRSDITDFEEVVKLDTQYISEWSMGLDFKILVKTVGVVVKGDGSM